MTAREILVAFWPLLALQFAVAAWALVDLVKPRKVKALPKWAWADKLCPCPGVHQESRHGVYAAHKHR